MVGLHEALAEVNCLRWTIACWPVEMAMYWWGVKRKRLSRGSQLVHMDRDEFEKTGACILTNLLLPRALSFAEKLLQRAEIVGGCFGFCTFLWLLHDCLMRKIVVPRYFLLTPALFFA